MEQNCRKWSSEIVEAARRVSLPPAEIQQHLSACPDCAQRWREQQRLTLTLAAVRREGAQSRPANERCEALMRDFAAAHRRASYSRMNLIAAAAAVLALAVGLAYTIEHQRQPAQHRALSTASRVQPSAADQSAAYDPSDDDDFVAVPYAPPLATGEFVSVVRTEMQAPALARMGIYVDASYGAEAPADVVVGEDGVPRAIRLIGAVQF